MPEEVELSLDLPAEFMPPLLPDDEDLDLKIKTLSGKEIPSIKLLKVDTSQMQSECTSYAAWVAVVGLKVDALEIKLEHLQRKLKKSEAASYLRHKSTPGIKKSEGTVDAEVLMDAEVNTAFEEVMKTKQTLSKYKAFRSALYAKRDMLDLISKGQRINMMTSSV